MRNSSRSCDGDRPRRVSWSSSLTRTESRPTSRLIRSRSPGVVAGARQVDGDIEARQGGAEFVGNVLQQPALGRQQGLDPFGHLVERPREFADLVLPVEPTRAARSPRPNRSTTPDAAAARARRGARRGSRPCRAMTSTIAP